MIIRKVPMRDELAAGEYAKDHPESYAQHYVAHLLSSMVHNPPLTVAAIMSLPFDDLESLVECAVEQLDYTTEFTETDRLLPIESRFLDVEVRKRTNDWNRIRDAIVPSIETTLDSIYGFSALQALGEYSVGNEAIGQLASSFGAMSTMAEVIDQSLLGAVGSAAVIGA